MSLLESPSHSFRSESPCSARVAELRKLAPRAGLPVAVGGRAVRPVVSVLSLESFELCLDVGVVFILEVGHGPYFGRNNERIQKTPTVHAPTIHPMHQSLTASFPQL